MRRVSKLKDLYLALAGAGNAAITNDHLKRKLELVELQIEAGSGLCGVGCLSRCVNLANTSCNRVNGSCSPPMPLALQSVPQALRDANKLGDSDELCRRGALPGPSPHLRSGGQWSRASLRFPSAIALFAEGPSLYPWNPALVSSHTCFLQDVVLHLLKQQVPPECSKGDSSSRRPTSTSTLFHGSPRSQRSAPLLSGLGSQGRGSWGFEVCG